jgi:hypothetical protein
MSHIPKSELYKLAKQTKRIHGKGVSKMNKQELFDLLESVSKTQQGSGIIGDAWKKLKDKVKDTVDKVRGYFFPPNKLPGGSQKMFDKYKNDSIVSIQVARTPLQGAITKFANWASDGKFDEKLKELGYDNAFHLFMKIKLSSGQTLILEKNERINLDESSPTFSPDTKFINVPIQKPIPLEEFMEKTRQMLGDHDFFQYSVSNNNCQKFIKSLLQANGLLTDPIENFIMQDAKELFSALPGWASAVAQFVTDTAGKASELISGQGRKKKKPKAKKLRRPKKRSS